MKMETELPKESTPDAKKASSADETVVMWRFSGTTTDNTKVFGEYPFTYVEGRHCYNLEAFWRRVMIGYIKPETVKQEAT